jgi:hypothetical protein
VRYLALAAAALASLALWWLYPLACAVIAGFTTIAACQIWRRAAQVTRGGER